MAIFEQGAFQQNQNDTPETIKRRRQMIREAMMSYGSASNVGEGIGQLLNGIATGVQMRGLDRAEQAGLSSANDARSKIYDAVLGGSKPVSSTPTSSSVPATMDSGQSSTSDLKSGIQHTAQSLGISPVDLATAISYETGGTFSPTQKGPRTQWGQHRGLIQFGEPQAQKYGVDWNNPLGSQLGENGAIAKYLRDTGVKPGMGLLDVYSAINAGGVGRYNASDANNGGAPGTVADKVNKQMADHRAKAMAMFGDGTQVASLDPSVGMAYAPQQAQSGADKVFSAIMPQTQQNSPQMPMRGGSGLDVWQGRATQGTATDGTLLTRLPDGSIQRTNRFGVTERMSPEGESMGASIGARQPQMQPQQVAQAGAAPMIQATPSQPQQTGQAPQVPMQGGGLNLQELMAQAQNPWLDDNSRAFANDLIQKELQKQDPAYQQAQKMKDLEYQKTQLELDQMRNPPSKWDIVTGKDGSIFRVNPQTGEHQTLYGPQAEPVKPTSDIQEYEYAKGQGFTGTFAEYQQQMKKAGAQSINIDQKAEGQFDKTLAEKQAASFDTMATEGMNAKADLAVIGELGNLLKGQGGMLTGLSGALAKYGIGGEGIGDLQAADALINKLIPSQRAPGSGSMSDRDVEMFRSSLPSLWKTPGGNQIILNTMQSLAQYKQAQGDIAQRVMIGEIDRKEAVKMLRELPNPLEGFRANMSMQSNAAQQAAPQAAPAQQSAAPIKIQSIEDYNRVPSGAQYVDPQGVVRIKK